MLTSKPLKILFVTSSYPTREIPFNAIFVKSHAQAISSCNNQVVVMNNLGCSRSIKGPYEFSDQEEDGLRVIRIKHKRSIIPKTSYLNYLWSGISIFRWLVKKEGFKPDIIHAHVFNTGFLAIILGKIYGIPIVITEHYTRVLKNNLSKREKIEFKFVMNKADIILPVSESLKKAILQYGIRNRIEVVANTVDMDGISPLNCRAAITNRKTILFIGQLVVKKGLPDLLKALSQLTKKRDDFRLDIVGDGPERTNYEELVLRLGLGEIVKFHGAVTDTTKKNEFIDRSIFLALPSLWETFGVVLIEAMAHGKPVVATSCDAVTEIVTEKRGILVPVQDTEALEQAIDYMLDHYKDYSPTEIARYVRGRFSYEVIGNKIDCIYRDLISNRGKQ